MDSEFKIYGELYKIAKERQVSDKFKVREFALKTFGRFEQKIKFQLTQDRCDLIDNYSKGDKVTIYFDIAGNETKDGKIFNNLNAWRIDDSEDDELPPPAPQSKKADPIPVGNDDELPF